MAEADPCPGNGSGLSPLRVLYICGLGGNPDGEKSYILPGGAKEIAALHTLVQQVDSKIPLYLKNGVFNLKAWQPEASALLPDPGCRAARLTDKT